MGCCQCEGIEQQFDSKTAARELKKYRRRGPTESTRLLIDALKTEGVAGMRLLDIGGGIGAVQYALLEAGGRAAVSVEASQAFLEAAQEEAARQGYVDRIEYRHGDFVEVAEHLAPADVVTLDRVICCYDDMPALVRRSAALAERRYGVVYPRVRWWMKAIGAAINLTFRVRRRPMRFFLHPPAAIEEEIRRSGLKPLVRRQTLLWQVALYGR